MNEIEYMTMIGFTYGGIFVSGIAISTIMMFGL